MNDVDVGLFEELNESQLKDLKSGTVSTLRRRLPELIPGFNEAFSMNGGIVMIDPSIMGKDGSSRPLAPEDLTGIRSDAEEASVKRWGVKIRTDRESVREVVTLIASEHRIDPASWLGNVPEWDGVNRLRTIAGDMGIGVQGMTNRGSVDAVVELMGRMLFMHPVAHALGMVDATRGLPLPLFVGADSDLLYDVLRSCSMGRPVMETSMIAYHEQDFTESFDPVIPYLILPNVPQVTFAGKMDRNTFRGILSKGFAYYRIPCMGKARGEHTMMPLMVGTVSCDSEDEDKRKAIQESIPIVPVTLDDYARPIPEADVLQCFAEARHYVESGHRIWKSSFSIKTDYSKRGCF